MAATAVRIQLGDDEDHLPRTPASRPLGGFFIEGQGNDEPPFYPAQSKQRLAGPGWLSFDLFPRGGATPSLGRVLFISGQFGIAPDGRLGEDFGTQCEQAMTNVERLLTAAEMTTANIVKLNYYATRASDFPTLVEIRQRRWAWEPAPAVTAIAVVALARPEYLIEIEATAVAPAEQGHE